MDFRLINKQTQSKVADDSCVLHQAAQQWSGFPLLFAQGVSNKQSNTKRKLKRTKSCFTVEAAMPESQVVLVTGGAGFLGQHVVKLLQERADFVKEIRVLDTKPYTNKLGHDENKPLVSIVGDLRNPKEVESAVRGVDAVIHTAGVVSFGVFPDYEAMEQVNVKGTSNLINACISESVQHLVFTSTIDVVIGFDEIEDGDESLPIPKHFLFPGYPDTKHRAEKMILKANGKAWDKGTGCLRTVSLRPNVMYGEGDPYYIPNALKGAQKNCGTLPRIGDGKALFQQAYVGNMAWAHIKALAALNKDANNVGGHAYFINDDTPVQNSFLFMEPFLRARGFALTQYSIPYPLIYTLFFTIESFLKLISPIYKINYDTALCSIIYINKTFYFNRKKAEEMLEYKPIYSWKESLENSLKYYVGLDI